MVIKFVEAEANNIKNNTIMLNNTLSNFPIISVGLVKILSEFEKFLFKMISAPITIKTANKEKIIKFKIRLKLPLFNSFSFFTYLEKSP